MLPTRMARMLMDLIWIFEVVLERLSLKHCVSKEAFSLSLMPLDEKKRESLMRGCSFSSLLSFFLN